jgi:ubiquinone/menaquinone biosynthesis C-methylase UbiE
MILRFLHWVASNGVVYDCIQTAVGANKVYSEVASRIPSEANPVILDIGGGTGTLRRFLSFKSRYICLDNEAPKLEAFRKKFPGGLGLLGDATRLPLPDGSVDTAVCTMVAHHLPEELLEAFLRECRRVLRPDGCFVFLDWLRPTTRVPSRILCALDRGAHPYREDRLRQLITNHFEIARADRFTILHEYFVMVLRKNKRADKAGLSRT